MLYKRPMFKMGGSPTGIATLTPRVNARIGFPKFSFLRGGGDKMFPAPSKNIPPSVGAGIESIVPSNILETITGGENIIRPKGPRFPKLAGLGYGTGIVAPIATMAYLNRPKTLAAKKFMQDFGPLDETLSEDELNAYYKEIDRLNKVGDEISFLDAFLLDPETGTYPKFMGRTEDREKKIKAEIAKKDRNKAEEIDDFYTEGKAATVLPGESVLDAVLREGKVISEKRAEDTKVPIIKDTKTDGETIEDSFEADFNRMQKRITKFLKDDKQETKGKVALALSDAVGTPGSLADKAAVLNKRLLGIAAAKKKDEKDIAKLAFAAATTLEEANITAGKKGATEKLIDRAQILSAIDKRTPDQDLELRLTRAALGDNKKLANLNQVLAAGKDVRKDIVNYKEQLSVIDKLDGGAKEQAQKTANDTKQDILSTIRILTSYGVDNETLRSLFGDDIKLFMADGGRAKMAVGGAMEASANPVDTKLSFNDLRTRLPQEITDDIVNLIANSEEALQDFAYIRTQGDVEKFNVKYGVNLVLPQDTA